MTTTTTNYYYVDGGHMGEREIAAKSRSAAAQQYAENMCLRTDLCRDHYVPIILMVASAAAVDAVRDGELETEDHLWTDEEVTGDAANAAATTLPPESGDTNATATTLPPESGDTNATATTLPPESGDINAKG